MGWIKGSRIRNEIPNVELIKTAYNLCKHYQNVTLEYIKAHTGLSDELSLGNEEADRLANEAIGLTSCPYDNQKHKYYFNIPTTSTGKTYGSKCDPKKNHGIMNKIQT